MEKPLRIFCPVWGRKHQNLLRNVLGRSLSWPKNLAAIQNSVWTVASTTDAEGHEAANFIQTLVPKVRVEIFLVPELTDPKFDQGRLLMHPLNFVLEKCVNENVPMLMATPDFIFGEGTLDAFRLAADAPGSCVTIAHIRVHPEIIPLIPSVPISNAKLLGMGLKHQHVSWINSERAVNNGVTFFGGITWQKIEPNISLVRHYLPSPFYVNFIGSDITFFNKSHNLFPHAFGLWDHVWPTALIEQGRLRFIGSSDAAMMMEVTDRTANIPPINPPGKTNQDDYFRMNYHNNIQKQFISVFRGE